MNDRREEAAAGESGFDLLVVDDVPEICQLFESICQRVKGADINLQSLTDPRKALELVASKPFDVVVSDFRMMHVDGLAVLAAAHDFAPQGRRLLMTGYNEIPAPAARIQQAHVDAYLHKPLKTQEVLILLLDMLRGDDDGLEHHRALAREFERMALIEEGLPMDASPRRALASEGSA